MPTSDLDFGDRFAKLGRSLGEREREHAEALAASRTVADELRAAVAAALADFHAAAASPQLEVGLSEVRANEKHVRAVEFEIFRGRHRAVVAVKSRGEVTLVGPFQQGKTEGPCGRFAVGARPELQAALGDFLEKFLEAAATP